jgi:hydrogenase-4 component E
MIHFADLILSGIILSVFWSLGSNRLMGLVKMIALQGVLVSLTPLLLEQHQELAHGAWIIFPITLLVKGVVIPSFLFMALKKVAIQREVDPIIGYHASLLSGLALILVSAFISDRLKLVLPEGQGLLLITAITTLASGLLLMMSRRKAITQVIGYLMLENGIYLLGIALAKQVRTMHVVEFGVLLDLLVGVMIMGIILYNIHSAFDDVDTEHLSQLKD